jgi:hypothetical protein
MAVEDINIPDVEIQGVYNLQRKRIGLEDELVRHKVKTDDKLQKWKFCGAAAKYYSNRDVVAYTAATMHQDMVDLTKEEDQDEERWWINSGTTVNVTASNEDMKNIIKVKDM